MKHKEIGIEILYRNMLSSLVFERPLPKDLDHLASAYIYIDLLLNDPTCWTLLPVKYRELAEYADICLMAEGLDPKIFDEKDIRRAFDTFITDGFSTSTLDIVILMLLRVLYRAKLDIQFYKDFFKGWSINSFGRTRSPYVAHSNHLREILHLIDLLGIDLASLDLLSEVHPSLLVYPGAYLLSLQNCLQKLTNSEQIYSDEGISFLMLSFMSYHRYILTSSVSLEEHRQLAGIIRSLYKLGFEWRKERKISFSSLTGLYRDLNNLCQKLKPEINIIHTELMTLLWQEIHQESSNYDRL